MKRRLFLQGVGGAALAAPYLSSLAPKPARAQSEYAQRLVINFTHNGTLLENYRTSARDGALDLTGLSTFADLAGLEEKMLQIRGLAMFPRGTNVMAGGAKIYFDPHDQGTGAKLTAAHNDPDSKWAQGISFDHFIAALVNPGTDKTPLVVSPTGAGFQDVKTVVSYKVAGDGKAFTPEGNPAKVYSALTGLFGTGDTTAPATEADYRVLRGESIMDLTRNELVTLQAKNMSGADKQRLQAWSELLRGTEKLLVPGACTEDVAVALGITDTNITAAGGSANSGGGQFGGGGGGSTEVKMTLGMEMLQNLFALNMICDANRVMLMHNQSFMTFNFDGMSHDADHHGCSHRTGSAAVGGDTYSPEKYEPMIKEIDTWYGKKFARMVRLFDSIPEGDGTLLDNTATMWLPELGDGEAHNNDDLPITIAGGMGGFLKQGVIVDVAEASSGGGQFGGGGFDFGSGGTPLNQLYVSLAHGLGATQVNEFGEADTNEVDNGITKPGPLSLIHT